MLKKFSAEDVFLNYTVMYFSHWPSYIKQQRVSITCPDFEGNVPLTSQP